MISKFLYMSVQQFMVFQFQTSTWHFCNNFNHVSLLLISDLPTHLKSVKSCYLLQQHNTYLNAAFQPPLRQAALTLQVSALQSQSEQGSSFWNNMIPQKLIGQSIETKMSKKIQTLLMCCRASGNRTRQPKSI